MDSKVLRGGGDPGLNRISIVRLLTTPAREQFEAKLDELAHSRLRASAPGSDLQLVWYQALMDAAVTPPSIQFVHSLVAGKGRISGIHIERDRRWEAILALARTGAPDAAELIQKELEKDPSDAGKRAAIHAEALMPNPETKKRWLSRILGFPDYEAQLTTLSNNPDQLPISKLREAGRYFYPVDQEQLARESVEPYFQLLPKLLKVHDEEYISRIVGPMYPPLCDPAIDERASQFLSQHPELPAAAAKVIKNNIQEDLRCIKGRR
jgi:hypothetical protein